MKYLSLLLSLLPVLACATPSIELIEIKAMVGQPFTITQSCATHCDWEIVVRDAADAAPHHDRSLFFPVRPEEDDSELVEEESVSKELSEGIELQKSCTTTYPHRIGAREITYTFMPKAPGTALLNLHGINRISQETYKKQVYLITIEPIQAVMRRNRQEMVVPGAVLASGVPAALIAASGVIYNSIWGYSEFKLWKNNLIESPKACVSFGTCLLATPPLLAALYYAYSHLKQLRDANNELSKSSNSW